MPVKCTATATFYDVVTGDINAPEIIVECDN